MPLLDSAAVPGAAATLAGAEVMGAAGAGHGIHSGTGQLIRTTRTGMTWGGITMIPPPTFTRIPSWEDSGYWH